MKTALDAHRINGFLLAPEEIEFAAKGEPLYDPRQEEGPDENLVLSVMAKGVKQPLLVATESKKAVDWAREQWQQKCSGDKGTKSNESPTT